MFAIFKLYDDLLYKLYDDKVFTRSLKLILYCQKSQLILEPNRWRQIRKQSQ